MEINVEKIGPCKAKVSIRIPPEKVDEELENTLQKTAQSVTFPGFRKGRAPKKLVIKRLGDLINNDVKEKLVQEAWTKVIDEHKLAPVEEPDIDLEGIEIEEHTAIELLFEVETKPDFELGEYKGIEVEVEPVEVKEEDVQKGLKALQSRFASLQPVKDKPVEKTHYLTLDITYKIAGEEDQAHKDCQANMALGIVDGIELGDRIETFIGKKTGDSVTYEIPALPDHFQPENLKGKAALAEAVLKEIRGITFPELDQEFLKKVGMNSVEELKDRIRDEALERMKAKREGDLDTKLMDILIKNHPFEIPEKLLIKQIENQENNLRLELMRMGMPEAKVLEETAKLDEKNRESAARNLRANFLYDKVAEKEKIYATENEIEEELKVIALQQNTTVDEIRRYYEEHGLLDSLRNFLRNQKIRKALRESAKIAENSPGASSQAETGKEADVSKKGEEDGASA